ncbi:MAG: DUF5106 domain-containing protein [Bacteroidota bacterium]|nr:DUF5106 domain-containing protein [Bacteroidota bacterium]
MNVRLLLIVLNCLAFTFVGAQSYKINVRIKGYTNDTLLLGYHYGDKQYIKDTAFSKTGEFTFEGDTLLDAGMYLVVIKPSHDYFQLLLDKDKQQFSIQTNILNLNEELTFKGSKLNQDFMDYVSFISNRKIQADSLGGIIKTAVDESLNKKLKERLNVLDLEVDQKQKDILKNQAGSMLSLVLKWSKDIEIPEFKGTKEEIEDQSFDFYKKHYFDYADFSDDRSVGIPLFHQKIDRYVQKLTVQMPDSISAALDYLLSKCTEGSKVFQYIVSNYLNVYANSKYVGMDGVYVHLVEKYYGQGKTPWVDEENLAKMVLDAKTLKPLLIDKIAPDIRMYYKDNTPIRLHDVRSPYTVLVFWAPDCGHCKQSMPKLVEFYKNYKSKGVEIFAVCSKLAKDESTCWEALDTLQMGEWINVTDKEHYSRFRLIYDIKTTPQVYILDENKRILTKKIAFEQLGEVMDKLIQYKLNETANYRTGAK